MGVCLREPAVFPRIFGEIWLAFALPIKPYLDNADVL
jgi:hypothetical protein